MWQSREGRWILGTVTGLALLLSGFVVLLWRIGLFDLPKDDPGAKTFAAVLALVGGLVAALLTFIGVLLRLSFDARTFQLQSEGEERLKMDTCIRAVGLMNTASANEAGQSQKAGALFALANMGQLEFALALLDPMWSKHEVSSSTAVWLIDKGLQDSKEHIQRQAAVLMRDNADQLKSPAADGIEWPTCLELAWMPKLSVYARDSIFEAMLRCLLSAPRTAWSQESLSDFVVRFHLIMSEDDNFMLQAGAALVLDVLLQLLPEAGDILFWEQPLDIGELRQRVTAALEDAHRQASNQYKELVQQLEEWAKPVPTPV